jgi:hypothetical protein
MRWTRQRFARDGIAGRVGERPVSDQQRADERCCSVRRSRVVLTPRRWRQVRGVKSAQPGLDKNISAGRRWQRARSPGRARRKPLKPLRAGMPGDSGVLVVTRVRSTNKSAHETAGALGIRRSPRPLRGGRFINTSGASRGEVVSVCLMTTNAPRSQSSSPAKAGDPVFRGVSDGIEKLRRTGYSAFAEYDGFCGAARRSNPSRGVKEEWIASSRSLSSGRPKAGPVGSSQ